jgi:UDP-2,4-diacetamido-2,4,6-trideoxy-beta-L-altropyranose hydrolase
LKIAIRVDASNEIGTGHFMRCLTLADALKQRRAEIHFLSRNLPEHFKAMLMERKHLLSPLVGILSRANDTTLTHSRWLGTTQEIDAEESLEALADQAVDWLIVDHYGLDARWESALRQTARNILVIDDLADRLHDCDVLLDQNLYANLDTPYRARLPEHSRLLLGPRYALVRDDFRRLHEDLKPRTGPVKRLLVFFGADPDNYTSRTVEVLRDLGSQELHVDVAIGAQHPYRAQIQAACDEHHFALHVQTSRMAQLMAAADLAIGAGGSATWERCCVGVPTFAICTADNQVRQVADAASAGLLYAPNLTGDLTLAIKRHISAVIENASLRHCISRNGMDTVDGLGALRVIAVMGCTGITIRAANREDARRLFEWRNHPTIRGVSHRSEIITWEDHQDWLASALTDPERLLLIGEREGIPVGVVRFDVQNGEAEISIYVGPDLKEAGLGRDLLMTAERWLSANRAEIEAIRAQVLGDNRRSRALFLGSGYRLQSAWYFKSLGR